jgi:aldose 1-epimerase
VTTTNYSSASETPWSTGQLFTLSNAHGMRVTISEHGAAPVSWWAPDRYGRMADVLLAHPGARVDGTDQPCAAGRWANQAVRWNGEMTGRRVSLWLACANASGGFAGDLEIEVHYELGDDGGLTIEAQARSTAMTPVNLGWHPYFNLNGGRSDVGDHMLQIDADYYLELDGRGVPAGVAAVSGTPFDFRKPAAIGPRLRWPDRQIGIAGGFDHCYWVGEVGGVAQRAPRQVARVYDPGSGRRLQVSTTEAGLRFCSGHWREGDAGPAHAGFRLQAGAGPGHTTSAHAAAVILRPGELYRQTTVYRLSLEA